MSDIWEKPIFEITSIENNEFGHKISIFLDGTVEGLIPDNKQYVINNGIIALYHKYQALLLRDNSISPCTPNNNPMSSRKGLSQDTAE